MILCCGEALIDMIPDQNGAFVPHPGGAVFNTAIGLGRQGMDVGLLSGVSTDLFGQVLVASLEDSDVTIDHLIRSDRPTTLAFVTLSNGTASYAFYDENTAGRMLLSKDLPRALPERIDALFFGGISLAVEPCANFYLAVLKENAAERLVMLDPNIRPQFIQDEGRYRERLGQILEHTDILKVSDEDLNWIDPTEADLNYKVQKILKRGPKIVCLTLGAIGVKLFSGEGLIAQAAPTPVDVVDTVGAGDAFNAGFLTSLSRSNHKPKAVIESKSAAELKNAIDFATAFASDTVERQGSNPAWNFKP
jgi:fructokinase